MFVNLVGVVWFGIYPTSKEEHSGNISSIHIFYLAGCIVSMSTSMRHRAKNLPIPPDPP
jgi:hypothetical protein